MCAFKDVVFLDIVDLDENPDNSLVLARLGDDEAPPAVKNKKCGRGRGKSNQGQFKKVTRRCLFLLLYRHNFDMFKITSLLSSPASSVGRA